ncbi:hypothetical protein CTI14_08365 [Methylobacterium radiotolerans]|nr:hypothetical protein CTI14_08365 [Methylobacterium radiotolerans]
MTRPAEPLQWPDALQVQVERRFLEMLPYLESGRPLQWETPSSLDPVVDWGFVKLSDVPLMSAAADDTHFFDFQSALSGMSTLASLQNGFRLVFMLTGDHGRMGSTSVLPGRLLDWVCHRKSFSVRPRQSSGVISPV